MAIYVASGQLSRGIAAATLRYASAMGSYPTSFREERDTFGPIQVRSNNPDAETLQNFEIGGDREPHIGNSDQQANIVAMTSTRREKKRDFNVWQADVHMEEGRD
ncbi:hypothetical protein F2Q69_00034844 [Brassica cretica]|uniref:Uncharacterized protein n=1 Tax=Brassica cretica TaxID=69181 RepID=A0A8S9SQU1_BRACR|nr:hypothetical protein F2Q69_00034844 [Brassica cretica]